MLPPSIGDLQKYYGLKICTQNDAEAICAIQVRLYTEYTEETKKCSDIFNTFIQNNNSILPKRLLEIFYDLGIMKLPPNIKHFRTDLKMFKAIESTITQLAVDLFRINSKNFGLRESLVLNAAKKGDLKMLRHLLEGSELSQESIEQAQPAIKNGHLADIQYLTTQYLQENYEFSQECREQAIINAAENGHVETLRYLTKENTISVPCAVMSAAENGHVKALQYLLENMEISQSCTERLVEKAALNGRYAVIKILLSKKEQQFSNESRGQAVINATKNNYRNIVELLLSEEHEIPLEIRKQAIAIAAENRSPEMIQILLVKHTDLEGYANALLPKTNLRQMPLPDKTISTHLQNIEDKKRAFRQELHKECDIEIKKCSDSFNEFVANTPSIFPKWLLKTFYNLGIMKLPSNIQILCKELRAFRAIESKIDAIASNMLDANANRKTSQCLREYVIENAARKGYLMIIQDLLPTGQQISAESRGRAVLNAAQKGYEKIVQFLLSNGQEIPEEYRKSAIDAGRLYHAVVRALLVRHEELREQAGQIPGFHQISVLRNRQKPIRSSS